MNAPFHRVLTSSRPIALAALLIAAAGCATAPDGQGLRGRGLDYLLLERTEPRPNRVHVLRVDLAGGGIEPAVLLADDPDGDGPAEAALTDPLELASGLPVLALINTNPWESLPDANGRYDRRWHAGQPVAIQGLAVSDGRTRSDPQPGTASIRIDAGGHVRFGDGAAVPATREGFAGFQDVVRDGVVVAKPGGTLHPRTAVGTDRSGRTLWLVVVDGRQSGYSEGMNLHELGELLRGLGCWHAVNMDGGGSSIMALADEGGRLTVVNSPSDRVLGVSRIRPLPSVLTILKNPSDATR